jgi:hypothetical protein
MGIMRKIFILMLLVSCATNQTSRGPASIGGGEKVEQQCWSRPPVTFLPVGCQWMCLSGSWQQVCQ